MKVPRVSVIIPVYQVEDYLERCVKSVAEQSEKNIEIILVDDGSLDKSAQLCDDLAREDDRIKVIHKKNGGLSSARNAGLNIAAGEYILFVDSDDWIDRETVHELYDIAERNGVDFVRFRPMYAGWPGMTDGTLCDFGTENGIHEGLYDKEGIEKCIYPRLFATPQLTMGAIVAAWRSLYSRSFLCENRLRFCEEVRYSEDAIFSAQVVVAAQSFYYLDGPKYYHYYYNRNSITKSFKKDRWDSCKKLIRAFEEEYKNFEGYDFSDQLHLHKLYCVANALGQRKMLKSVKEREEYCSEICNDAITKDACQHLSLLDVPLKLRMFMELVRWNQSWILARI